MNVSDDLKQLRENFSYLTNVKWDSICSPIHQDLYQRVCDSIVIVERLLPILNCSDTAERLITELVYIRDGVRGRVYFKNIVLPELSHFEYLLVNDSNNHGGVREGAGRKKKAPTKMIRVDSELAEQFKVLSDLYRSQFYSDKLYLLRKLSYLETCLRDGKIE